MKSRGELAQLFADRGYTRGVEIGVRAGFYSLALCKTIPNLTLYGVDPNLAYQQRPEYVTQQELDDAYRQAVAWLSPYPNFTFVKKSSFDAAADFEDGSLDFIYIDGDHDYEFVSEELRLWGPKVIVGGVISGHDYDATYGGVIQAVNEYVAEHGYTLELIPPFGATGDPGDWGTSWYFTK